MAKAKTLRRTSLLLLTLLIATGTAFYLRPLSFFWEFQSIRLRLAGTESHFVQIGGHSIHYYVRGSVSGSPVVLVHGLGGRSEDWVSLAPYLVDAGYRVYMPDLLGYGRSDRPTDADYSIPQEASLVVSFLDAMQLKQINLVGWSMGGWIVQKIAAEHPERIRHLVLIDSAGLRMAPEWDTRLFTPTTAAELDQLNALLMPNPPKIPGFVTADILRQSKQHAWVIKRALASMLKANDVTDEELPSLKMPVLVLWGDQDHITPLSEGRAIHKLIPQSRLAIAPGCGHLAPEQCANLYGPELVRFLQSEDGLAAEEQTLHPPV